MPPTLPNPGSIITAFFSALANYLQQKAIAQTFADIADFLWQFITVVETIVNAISFTFRNVKLEWQTAYGFFSDVGGVIKGQGIDSWAMWHHLRYVLMPNTINWVLNWVWLNWVRPLRRGLIRTIGWTARWDWYQQGWINDNRTYTRSVQVTGRTHRERFVYPQLSFLLSPWRVSYWYQQAMAVSVARFLNYTGHTEVRDTVSRVVYSNMSRLWASFDKHLVEWLQTDTSKYGYGSDVPTFPPGSGQPMPPLPPSPWEPFIKEPPERPYPPGSPDIPAVDWSA